MKIDELQRVQLLFMDTAPFIYYLERNSHYEARMRAIFSKIHLGDIQVLTSVITAAEVLTKPFKSNDPDLEKLYKKFLFQSHNINFLTFNLDLAERTAELRAKYNLRTPDAIQLASAIASQCQVFLTNDGHFDRVQELEVWLIDNLEI